MRKFINRFLLFIIAVPALFFGGAEEWCRDWEDGTFGGGK